MGSSGQSRVDRKVDVGRPPRSDPMVNRVLTRVLSSPLSGLVDGSLSLLTVTGRRSGRSYRLPVQYAAGPDALWLCPGQPERKTWWRNLRAPAPVTVRLMGREVAGIGQVVDGVRDPGQMRHGLEVYARRFPRTARKLAGGEPSVERATDAAPALLLVRVDIDGASLAAARRATLPAERGPVGAVRRHPLASYVLLAFLLSWGWWIPVAVAGGEASHVPGLVGPALAGLAVTLVAGGRAAVGELLSAAVRWRLEARWYAVALAPLAVGALTLLGLAATGRDLPGWDALAAFPGLTTTTWLSTFAVVLVVNGFGEEVGWRGVAWPRLRQRHSLLGAAGLLLVPWVLWHVPLFWLDTGLGDLDWLMVPGWVLGLGAGALVLGWLYERTRSSLLCVALFHAALNMASATEGTAGLPAAAASAAVIVAAVIIIRHRAATAPGDTDLAAGDVDAPSR